MRLFERNIFVIETFALSPLIPELYWFSWESLWSIFWLSSMVLLAYLLDDSLMWADFQVYIKDASFLEEHFCHETFALSPLIPELYWFSWERLWSIFWLWSMVLLAYLLDDSLMWADFQVHIKMRLYERNIFVIETSLYLLSFLSCIDSREKAFGVFFDYDPWSF